ncbi:MAG TPA: PKD domain-containing protein [Gemmatimonadales bacterium]
MRRILLPLCAVTILTVACSESLGPVGRDAAPRRGAAATTTGSGITLDQSSGVLNDGVAWGQGGTHVGKGFQPTNPHLGDAIVATFFWRGTSNTITTVADHLCDPNNTPVGNTYTLVEYVSAGGYSMATYVATNVQGFPDPATTSTQLLCVHAIFSNAITEGGVVLSAYQGVNAAAAAGLGNHHAASGSGSTTTVADPGAIAVGAGALVYAVTMSDGVVGTDPPAGFTNITNVSDSAIKADGEYAVFASGGTADPHWNWYFTSPHSWLATALALNPATVTNQPPTAAFTSSCSGLTCSFTSTSSAPSGSISAYSWTFGDGGTSTVQNPSHTYVAAGTQTVTLTVTDNQGATNSVSHSVTVTAAATGIVPDKDIGTLNEQNVGTIAKGFNPTNPHIGDAIVATFVWTGPATITSVSDFQTNAARTPLGNTFHLVEQVSAGGISMATYVATNIQGFPDPNPDPTVVYAVQAVMSQPVPDGGIELSAYSGVAPVFTDAVGGHSSGSGVSSSATVSDAGSIPITAGALTYAVTSSNGIVGRSQPPNYARLSGGPMSDNFMVAEGDYMVASAAGTTDPQWTWGGFSSPATWLASDLALNPASGTTNQPPVAAFSSSCSGDTCSFTSTSSAPSGSISSYSWAFGDGGTSTVQNPSHTYAAGGTYTATLTVTDNLGATNSVSHSVTVNQPPVASFTSSCSSLTCTFTNSSSDPDGTIASNSWTFGDAGTSTAQSPSHTYAAGGTYTVTLTVTDNLGATNSVSHNVTVAAANQPPVAAFSSSCSGDTCNFTSTSSAPSGSISSYSWAFGDGGTSTVQNPSHTYAAGGSYTVTLTVTDNLGATNSVSHGVTVNQPPLAAFSPSCSGDTCSFTSTSSDPDGSITSYIWAFGDGATSTVQNPSHTYTTGGTYTVTLTVTDNLGATNSVSHSVTVNQPPVAAFNSSCSGDTCAFTSTSSDPDGSIGSYSWAFGDGGTSTVQNPSHTYAVGNTYTVTLMVTDNLGATRSVSHSVTANRPPTAAFSSSCNALTCGFTSTSSDPDGSISAYQWTFGDGTTSTAQNPSHTYATGGTYTVTLTVTDNGGATNAVSHTVTANTPPSVNAGPNQTVVVGLLYTLNASFSDPDFGPWTYTIDWGDGSSSSGNLSSPGSFSAGHTYLVPLTSHTVTVTVTDHLGASGRASKTVTVLL